MALRERKRKIEIGVTKISKKNIRFRIVNQTHRGESFFKYNGRSSSWARMSNGVTLSSSWEPVWGKNDKTLYVLGIHSESDRREVIVPIEDFKDIEAAIDEYNNINPKGDDVSDYLTRIGAPNFGYFSDSNGDDDEEDYE